MAARYWRIATGQPIETVIKSTSGPNLTALDIVVVSCDFDNIVTKEELLTSLDKLRTFLQANVWPPT